MKGVVQKYGGTSVATTDKIMAVAQRIAEVRREGRSVAVVASAMGKTTDELIALAHDVGGDPGSREMDSLLATGEQRTVALLAMALESLGIPSVSLTGYQAGFITTNRFSKAKIQDIQIEKVQKHLGKGKVVVLAGFQGIDTDDNITTLGRGGSDTTAVALAAKLGWDCEIYTDVNGVYSVDPRRCAGAKHLQHISYDEMMEMAALGAGVLETRSVELAKKYGVKLFLGRSLERDLTKGTYIMDTKGFEDMPVTGISLKESCTMVEVSGLSSGADIAKLFRLISERDINVDMISRQSGQDGDSLSFSCPSSEIIGLRSAIEDKFSDFIVDEITGLTKVSLVGAGMVTHSGIAGKAFNALTDAGVEYYQITTSDISISVMVMSQDANRAAAALASAFELI